MDIIERARKLRKTIEILSVNLDDDGALDNIELLKQWSSNTDYSSGERVAYKGKLYRVLQTHTSQEGWNPVDAVSLFAEILPGQDGTEIGDWVQSDSTNPYKKGDKVRFNGKIYKSLINGNVWSPETYSPGWEEVDG